METLTEYLTRDTTLSKHVVEPPEDSLWPTKSLKLEGDTLNGMPISDYARSQLLQRVGFPVPFYDRLSTDKTELRLRRKLVRHLLRQHDSDFLLRQRDGEIVACLTNQYARLNHGDIFWVLDSADIKPISVKAVISPLQMRLYVFVRRIVMGGDELYLGAAVENSEVGYCAASIKLGLFRTLCENSLIVPSLHVTSRIYHSGGAFDEDGIRRIQLQRVARMITEGFSDENLRKRIADVEGAVMALQNEPLEEPEGVLRVVAARLDLSERETGYACQALREEERGNPTAWGVLNAITRLGHQARSQARAMEFEEMGGRLLRMGHKQWLQLAEQAKALSTKPPPTEKEESHEVSEPEGAAE